ncbi:MAG TPA: hypothetical protein VMG35_15550, partial [Bryobacteraceae bacterium]|nr:hypothetical protein [Bryobacteraceae bacterium]
SVQVGFGAQIATNSRWISPSSAPPLSVPANVFARVGEPIDLALVQPGSGEAPVPLSASGLPPGARFDAATARLSWTPDLSQLGSHDLAFTTPAGGTAASAHMKITVGSGEPVATELVNAASQSPDSVCSPGSVASLLGQWLNNADDPVNATAPRVYVNGSVAPVLSATSTRVDFVCPDGTPGAQLQVWLENNSGKTAPLTTMLRNSAPGIFTLNGSTQGLILLDGSVPATVRSFASSGQPAQPGDEVAIRATGFGPDAVVSVKLGDVEAPVLSVSPVNNLPGVYDIRVKLPAGVPVGDTVPALLRVAGNSGGSSESNPATMAIELPRP